MLSLLYPLVVIVAEQPVVLPESGPVHCSVRLVVLNDNVGDDHPQQQPPLPPPCLSVHDGIGCACARASFCLSVLFGFVETLRCVRSMLLARKKHVNHESSDDKAVGRRIV